MLVLWLGAPLIARATGAPVTDMIRAMALLLPFSAAAGMLSALVLKERRYRLLRLAGADLPAARGRHRRAGGAGRGRGLVHGGAAGDGHAVGLPAAGAAVGLAAAPVVPACGAGGVLAGGRAADPGPAGLQWPLPDLHRRSGHAGGGDGGGGHAYRLPPARCRHGRGDRRGFAPGHATAGGVAERPSRRWPRPMATWRSCRR